MFGSTNKRRIAVAGVGLAGVLGLASQTVLAVTPPTPTPVGFHLFDSGCRLADTRATSAIGGTNRTFSTLLTAAQGGNAGGCAVPVGAAAVEVSISTVGGSPNKAGYIRAGATVDPTNTVLQFLQGQGTSVTTTVAVNQTTDPDTFVVKVNGATVVTHVVVDVLGYWTPVLT